MWMEILLMKTEAKNSLSTSAFSSVAQVFHFLLERARNFSSFPFITNGPVDAFLYKLLISTFML